MSKFNVFVYGTLLSGSTSPASSFVNATVIAKAIAPGKIYDLGWFPGFKDESVTADTTYVVRGELISVDEEGLERLDAYEGVPDLYRRGETTVKTEDGNFVPAFVYVYNGPVNEADFIRSGDFISYDQNKEAA